MNYEQGVRHAVWLIATRAVLRNILECNHFLLNTSVK